jgi:hypothetical protein
LTFSFAKRLSPEKEMMQTALNKMAHLLHNVLGFVQHISFGPNQGWVHIVDIILPLPIQAVSANTCSVLKLY